MRKFWVKRPKHALPPPQEESKPVVRYYAAANLDDLLDFTRRQQAWETKNGKRQRAEY